MPASGPCTSILPSVETSQKPTAPRTVVTSRLTVSSQLASPGRGKILRAQPGTGLDEHGALLGCPLVRGRQPRRAEMLAAMRAGERADRHRHGRRAIAGGAGRGDGLAGERGHHGEAVDVRQLALVGRHAERGVALEVLDRAKALAVRQRDVGGGNVVLEIDKSLASIAVTCQSGATAALSSSTAGVAVCRCAEACNPRRRGGRRRSRR